jgi:hypothetical protein
MSHLGDALAFDAYWLEKNLPPIRRPYAHRDGASRPERTPLTGTPYRLDFYGYLLQ